MNPAWFLQQGRTLDFFGPWYLSALSPAGITGSFLALMEEIAPYELVGSRSQNAGGLVWRRLCYRKKITFCSNDFPQYSHSANLPASNEMISMRQHHLHFILWNQRPLKGELIKLRVSFRGRDLDWLCTHKGLHCLHQGRDKRVCN